MNILIVGCGKAGRILTKILSKEGHDITVMDIRGEVVKKAMDKFDVQSVEGNALSVRNLLDAGVEQAKIVIAMTESDETNIMCCMMSRKLGAHHSIARVRNPMFSEQLVFMRDQLNISLMVNPEYQTANEIARMLRYPNALHVESFAGGRMELAELRVTPDGVMDGLMLSTLPKKLKLRLLVCAVMRGEECLIPDGNFVLRANDRIYITAAHSELSKFYKQFGDMKNRIRSVLIVGGGKISYYLARQLLELNMQVKIIEQDRVRCEQLSNWFSKAKVICADGTDQNVLLEEGLVHADACITLTGIDEENIILSLYAKKIGVEKVVTKINRTSLLPISDSVGLENIISPKNTTAALILQYIRGKEDSESSENVTSLYRLADEKLEAIEFIIRKNARYVGVPLKDLKSNRYSLIAGIIRNNKRIIPTGADCLKLNDSVIVVTTNPKTSSLSDIFEFE